MQTFVGSCKCCRHFPAHFAGLTRLVLDGNCYEMATFNEGKCLLPTCSKSGRLTIFKLQAVKKLIECAVERHDLEIRDKMQDILNSQGEQASVQLHKNCYCSYTSKDHIKNLASRKTQPQTSLNHQLPGLEDHK